MITKRDIKIIERAFGLMVCLEGVVIVRQSVSMDREQAEANPEAREFLEKDLTEKMLRVIYGDVRKSAGVAKREIWRRMRVMKETTLEDLEMLNRLFAPLENAGASEVPNDSKRI